MQLGPDDATLVAAWKSVWQPAVLARTALGLASVVVVARGREGVVATAVSPSDAGDMMERLHDVDGLCPVLRDPPAGRRWALAIDGGEHLLGTAAVPFSG